MQTNLEILEAKLKNAKRRIRNHTARRRYTVQFTGYGPYLVYSDLYFEYHIDEIGEGVRGAMSCSALTVLSFSAPGIFAKGTLNYDPPDKLGRKTMSGMNRFYYSLDTSDLLITENGKRIAGFPALPADKVTQENIQFTHSTAFEEDIIEGWIGTKRPGFILGTIEREIKGALSQDIITATELGFPGYERQDDAGGAVGFTPFKDEEYEYYTQKLKRVLSEQNFIPDLGLGAPQDCVLSLGCTKDVLVELYEEHEGQ